MSTTEDIRRFLYTLPVARESKYTYALKRFPKSVLPCSREVVRWTDLGEY